MDASKPSDHVAYFPSHPERWRNILHPDAAQLLHNSHTLLTHLPSTPGAPFSSFKKEAIISVSSASPGSERTYFAIYDPDGTRPQPRPKRYGCPRCTKMFDRPSARDLHVLVHTGEKPHGCSLCDRRFSTVSNRNRHMRSCNGLREPSPSGDTSPCATSPNLVVDEMPEITSSPETSSSSSSSATTPTLTSGEFHTQHPPEYQYSSSNARPPFSHDASRLLPPSDVQGMMPADPKMSVYHTRSGYADNLSLVYPPLHRNEPTLSHTSMHSSPPPPPPPPRRSMNNYTFLQESYTYAHVDSSTYKTSHDSLATVPSAHPLFQPTPSTLSTSSMSDSQQAAELPSADHYYPSASHFTSNLLPQPTHYHQPSQTTSEMMNISLPITSSSSPPSSYHPITQPPNVVPCYYGSEIASSSHLNHHDQYAPAPVPTLNHPSPLHHHHRHLSTESYPTVQLTSDAVQFLASTRLPLPAALSYVSGGQPMMYQDFTSCSKYKA